MYKLRLIISSFLVLCAGQIYAQLDSIQYLDEVLIIDSKLNEYATGFKLIQISDTIIKRDPSSLTDVLRFNSSIYFKENGYTEEDLRSYFSVLKFDQRGLARKVSKAGLAVLGLTKEQKPYLEHNAPNYNIMENAVDFFNSDITEKQLSAVSKGEMD